MTDAELEHLFTYHPPTEEQTPKYAAIREAEATCSEAILGAPFQSGADSQLVFDIITRATHQYAKVINANTPGSADKSAALRCVRLARMAANEAVQTCIRNPENGHMVAFFLEQCRSELIRARWQASAAIATSVPHA